uniref:Mitochondrial fission 1 protein n=1 Tax=Salix viminalis TaxID=40686 RepID=A0A6N2L4M6_SALVM
MGAGLRSPQEGDPTSKFVAEGAAQAAAPAKFSSNFFSGRWPSVFSSSGHYTGYRALFAFVLGEAQQEEREKERMEAKLGKVIESITNFFTGADQIPWCDRDIVVGCEQEVREAEKGSSDEFKNECIMRLSWALVHSRQTEDVQRGIAMLDSSLGSTTSPLKLREKLYLLAVGYYRSGDYSRSRELVEDCLKIEPEWRQAQSLKKAIEDRIKKDGMIGIGIATAAVGVVAGGIAAALAQLALIYSASSSIVAITGHFARILSAIVSGFQTEAGIMRFGIFHCAYVFFALMMMIMSISPNTIRLSGGNENKMAMARRLVRVGINDYEEPGASGKHLPSPPGDELGDKAQDYQEPGSNPKHVPPQPPSEDGLV